MGGGGRAAQRAWVGGQGGGAGGEGAPRHTIQRHSRFALPADDPLDFGFEPAPVYVTPNSRTQPEICGPSCGAGERCVRSTVVSPARPDTSSHGLRASQRGRTRRAQVQQNEQADSRTAVGTGALVARAVRVAERGEVAGMAGGWARGVKGVARAVAGEDLEVGAARAGAGVGCAGRERGEGGGGVSGSSAAGATPADRAYAPVLTSHSTGCTGRRC